VAWRTAHAEASPSLLAVSGPDGPQHRDWMTPDGQAHVFRPDIEGLRAIAVVLVLLFHARVPGFDGGFVGVDVFFVLSGFLITSLLVHELRGTGTVRLGEFWGRRARRLLPASALVIVVTIVAARQIFDPLTASDIARDGLAAALFSANIRFGLQDSYFADNLQTSPLLHFWSLGVEEQFYLVWPSLLLVLSKARRAAPAMIAALWVMSLVFCLQYTLDKPTQAFYWLPTRAWELLTGAGLAIVGVGALRLSGQARTVIASIGLAAIGAATVLFDEQGFPGAWPLIPVAATAALLLVGGVNGDQGVGRVLAARPLQWIGLRSYAIYLWHFPALILFDAQLARNGSTSTIAQRLAVLAATVALAAITFQVVENPIRRHRSLQQQPARSLALGAGLIAVSALAAVAVTRSQPELAAGAAADQAELVTTASTTLPATAPDPNGVAPPAAASSTTSSLAPANPDAMLLDVLAARAAANASLLEAGLATSDVPSNLDPSVSASRNDKPAIYDNGCILDPGTATVKDCFYGDLDSSRTIVLFGDSHAAQWFQPLYEVATEQGFRMVVMTKKRCPTAEIPTVEFSDECVRWRSNVIDRVAALQPDVVLMSAYRYRAADWTATMDADEAWRIGITDTVEALVPHAGRVVLLGDTPTPLEDIPSCVAGNLSNVGRCVNSRDGAIRPDRLQVERDVATQFGALAVPTSDWLCAPNGCPVIVGNTLMYRDDSHITTAAARLLKPYIADLTAGLLTT
jgi:peptidoglycan/LPS O-acetylase OafA/YrhL